MISEPMETLSTLDFRELAGSGLTIFAQRPWTATSAVLLLDADQTDANFPRLGDFEYLLETSVIAEWIEGLVRIDTAKIIDVVLFYAENDAFPPWLNTMAQLQGVQTDE